ncbi:MAG: hypothetical protein ACOC12_02310, partial [Bacteroidota bacterium]
MKTQLHLLQLLFTLLLLFWGISLVAQTPSKHFLEIFEKETNQIGSQESKYGNFKHTGKLSFFPDTLPVWFFQPPVPEHNQVYAIGISDPDLPAQEGFQQAYYRARVMAVLFNGARIEYFRDVFTSDQDQGAGDRYRQRFDTFFRLT